MTDGIRIEIYSIIKKIAKSEPKSVLWVEWKERGRVKRTKPKAKTFLNSYNLQSEKDFCKRYMTSPNFRANVKLVYEQERVQSNK